MKKKKLKKSGWASTKEYPHRNHPARYKKEKDKQNSIKDKIIYITFTHEDEVILDNGRKVKTIPLNGNINPKEWKKTKSKSYAYPKVYVGKRSALGKEIKDYNLSEKDKELIDQLFNELPREKVRYSSKQTKKK